MFKLWTVAEAEARGKTLSDDAFNEINALRNFFYRMYPEFGFGHMPDIYTYQGLADTVEVKFIRFEWAGKSYTFVIQDSLYDYFITSWEDESPHKEWCDRPNQCVEMVRKHWKRTVTKMPIELPMDILTSVQNQVYGWEHLTDGDFTQVYSVCARMAAEMREKCAYVTHLADKLGHIIKQKDHDLYLSFKGVDFFQKMNIGRDRVYPKLPESGEVSLGDSVIDLDDWYMYNKIVQVNVKRIGHASNQINRMIKRYRGMISTDVVIQDIFDAELKIQLMAASHFLKRIYGYSAEHGMEIMEGVANDVIARLTKHGGNIGLDLNEWVVYQYHDDNSMPTAINDVAELDFKNGLYNRYTQSFVEALYAYLLDTPNPYIKPYTWRQVVEGDDGIAIGSIRQV